MNAQSITNLKVFILMSILLLSIVVLSLNNGQKINAQSLNAQNMTESRNLTSNNEENLYPGNATLIPSYNPNLILENISQHEDANDTIAKYATPLAATPFKYWGYEQGTRSTGWEWGASQYQAGTTDRLVQDPNYKREGHYSLKATVKLNDRDASGTERSEVLQRAANNPYFKEGDIVHYIWYTLFPTNFPFHPKWHVWTQWHQASDTACCQPDLQFVLHGDKMGLWVINAQGNSDILWQSIVQRGHWYKFDLTVKWSTSNQGFVKLSVDNTPKVNINHITLDPRSQPYTTYMKQGLYRDKTNDLTQSVYHDLMHFHYH